MYMGMCMQRHVCGDQILTCKVWASIWVSGFKFKFVRPDCRSPYMLSLSLASKLNIFQS